jgi:hypothetical protein
MKKQEIAAELKKYPPSTTRFKGHAVVFVDPQDEELLYWWPAMARLLLGGNSD